MNTPDRDIADDEKLKPRILTVAGLLAERRLNIPLYQRPYKWSAGNVRQLFADIATFKDSPAYRLGTIVFHENGGNLDIVDGQQRTITLLLALKALIRVNLDRLERRDLKERLQTLAGSVFAPKFSNRTTKFNLHANYREITRIVGRPDFTEEMVDFLLNRCEVVTFALGSLTEAFQFFDSQNARGRDLEPHDLLKAFHLREFGEDEEQAKARTVGDWEDADTVELADLFSKYLYRIRSWSRGVHARRFGKGDTPLFKGVNLDRVGSYPYVGQLRIAHHFVDHFNGQYERKVRGDHMGFPFQLDQTIINGRRFFEMISHYHAKVGAVARDSHRFGGGGGTVALEERAAKIMITINNYPGMHRDGDRYVREIFDCLLIYYCDKFGADELSRAVEKIFLWAYGVRIRMQVVQWVTVDNHVVGTGLFQRLKEATEPQDFLQLPVEPSGPLRSKKTAAIYELFQKMGYHE